VESELLCLWAAMPIYQRGRVIGILEVGSPMAPIVRAIRLVAGGDVAVLPAGETRRTVESSNPQLFTEAAAFLGPQEGQARQVFVLQSKTYAATLIPLKDFSGREAGRLAILSDASAVTEILAQSNALTFGISFLGLALAAALLILLTVRLDKFYRDLAALYDEACQTRDFLQSISENSPDITVMTDVDGRVTYVSPRVREVFGYRPEEVLGTPAATYYQLGMEEARAVMQRLRVGERITNYETTLRAGDGRWVEVNVSMALLRNAGGEVTGTLGIIKDLSEATRPARDVGRSQPG